MADGKRERREWKIKMSHWDNRNGEWRIHDSVGPGVVQDHGIPEVRAVELPPGDIVISREELRAAYRKAYTKPWDDRDGLLGALEAELFGEREG